MIATTSARLRARIALATDMGSAPSVDEATLARFRKPAVSISFIGVPSGSTISVSTASLVVPDMSLTMARGTPVMAFTREDLPTLGRPTIATASGVSLSSSSTTFGGGSAYTLYSLLMNAQHLKLL